MHKTMTHNREKWHRVLKYAFLLLLTVIMMYPIAWMIVSSVKTNEEIFDPASVLPVHWIWENYLNGWHSIPRHTFGEFFVNSFMNSGLIVAGTLFSCSLAAFAFARLKFKGKKILFAMMMATLMLPHQILLIPRYILFTKFGWTGSYKPLIVPAFFAQVSGAFMIYMLVQFMRGVPMALEEAAIIDGCGFFRRFYHIMLPNCKPALFSVAIFAFIWSWDDFLNQLIYLDSIDQYTVALALRMFMDDAAQINWGELFAMSTLSLLPCTIIFASAQKHFVEGIATSGIK